MKLYIIRYNDSCDCHPEIRHVIVFANSKEEAHKLAEASSVAFEGNRYWSTYEYAIEEGFADDI